MSETIVEGLAREAQRRRDEIGWHEWEPASLHNVIYLAEHLQAALDLVAELAAEVQRLAGEGH